MRKSPESDPVARLIATAAMRGVIDRAQASALTSLAAEIEVTAAADGAEIETEDAARLSPATEERRAFNPVLIAYSAGAMLVVFALGWFLAERWRDLGAGGVLAVSAGYAIAFAVATRELRRRGFRVASGLTATLAIGMTPVWTFAILRLAGEWPPATDWSDALARYEPWVASRWIILDLATIGVACAAIRRVRFFTVALPIAAGFVALLVHLGQALGDPRLAWYVGPYYLCVIGTLALGVAYLIDQRQGSDDYALWFYVAGGLALLVGYVQVWQHIGWWRHALPAVAFALVLAALYLRRRVLLIGGGIAAFGYLGYLAFDVFEDVLALPIALAGLGLLVIGATVWMQRRFPVLVARVGGERPPGRKALPAGWIAAFGPVVIAVAAMLVAVSEARERTAERDWLNNFYRLRARNEVAAGRAARRTPGADAVPLPPSRPRPR